MSMPNALAMSRLLAAVAEHIDDPTHLHDAGRGGAAARGEPDRAPSASSSTPALTWPSRTAQRNLTTASQGRRPGERCLTRHGGRDRPRPARGNGEKCIAPLVVAVAHASPQLVSRPATERKSRSWWHVTWRLEASMQPREARPYVHEAVSGRPDRGCYTHA